MPQLDSTDHALLIDIVAYGERAIRHLGLLSADDEKTFDSVVLCLSVVGEAAWKLSKAAQQAYPEVPWLKIAGMRHRLVHDYGEVDSAVSYRAVTEHLPSLLEAVRKALKDQGEAD